MAAEITQDVLDGIQQDRLMNTTPALAYAQQRPDARAMMKNWNYQYPFNAVLPIPTTFIFDAKAGIQQVATLPDGTLIVGVTGQPSSADLRMWGSFDGIAPGLADLTDNSQLKGVFPITQNPRLWFLYGKSQFNMLANADGLIYVECYMGADGLIG